MHLEHELTSVSKQLGNPPTLEVLDVGIPFGEIDLVAIFDQLVH